MSKQEMKRNGIFLPWCAYRRNVQFRDSLALLEFPLSVLISDMVGTSDGKTSEKNFFSDLRDYLIKQKKYDDEDFTYVLRTCQKLVMPFEMIQVRVG
jgi:hypothetical protein